MKTLILFRRVSTDIIPEMERHVGAFLDMKKGVEEKY